MEPDIVGKADKANRRKEVIDICLDHFIVNGFKETSTRSLSAALQLQSAGLYYYFPSKDEAVLTCAEEAAMRLERALILPAIEEFDDLDRMMANLKVRADEMAPTMRFFVAVCTVSKYIQSIRPILKRLEQRYDGYTERLSEMLGCSKSEAEPYLYMLVNSVSSYMIFSDDVFVTPLMKFAENKFTEFIKKKNQRIGSE